LEIRSTRRNAMTASILSPQELRAAANKLPWATLAHLPTPLEEAPRFAAAIGSSARIFIKRDDCTGLLLGGNKARHNEFLMGDALAQGCDLVVWGAGIQSNNCRQTAAACAKLGLECRLYLSRNMGGRSLDDSIPEAQGNLLLDYLVGAKVEFTNAAIGPGLDDLLASKAKEFRRAGRRPYFWNRSRVVPLSAVSYALCVAEIAEQLGSLNPAAMYVSSSGGTGAGVALGKALLGLNCRARLICPMHWPWHIPTDLAAAANAAAEMMNLPHRLKPEDIDADETHIAPGYGLPSEAGREALHLLATTEAILVDPVYSAKALGALIADVRKGKYQKDDAIVFIHTGGIPAIFANPESVFGERGASAP
jgi:1-aminocyclopropane-1-carboxylate deaminase/D-cysteine desulfhydrase-like pyridoxal-dependent ACC family enzyme